MTWVDPLIVLWGLLRWYLWATLAIAAVALVVGALVGSPD